MTTPPPLETGDTIGIIAPARNIGQKELAPALKIFQSWNLNVKTGKNLFNKYHQFAGKDEERASDLQEMINNPDIKAIFCARGGYGTVRTIQHIKWEKLAQNPKWIVGYSDITTLHSHINNNLNIKTLHGIMPLNFPADGKENHSLLLLKKILFGEKIEFSWDSTFKTSQDSRAEGILTGGNLSVLYSLIGTPYDIDPKNKILFLEDLDEYLYHVDRMMMNLKLAKKFENCAALLIGGMTDMNDNNTPFGKSAYEIIENIMQHYNIPVFYNCPVGHLKKNFPLILGEKVTITRRKNKVNLKFTASLPGSLKEF